MEDRLKAGDYLLTDFGGWDLHGIYAGSGRVLSFLYNGWTFDPFGRVPFDEFLMRDLRVRRFLRPAHAGQAVVARALSRLGENVELDLGETCYWAVTDSMRVRHGSFVDVRIRP